MKIIDSNNKNWEITLQKGTDLNFVSEIIFEEKEIEIPLTEFVVKNNKIRISQGGQNIIAFVVKEKDTWWVNINGKTLTFTSGDVRKSNRKDLTQGSLLSPMPGTILDVKVSIGQSVEMGDALLIMEAMKMEHKITAPFNGTVKKINCDSNQKVDRGFVLIELEQN